jgi:hypothetical protein
MRYTRVAAAVGAAAVAAGLPRNLQQASQWLQHIKDTPVAELEEVWVQRAERVNQSLNGLLNLHDGKGKLPPATAQQLLPVFQLLCATIVQLLKQVPGVSPSLQHPAGGIQAASSSSSGSGRATEPVRAATKLRDLLQFLQPNFIRCAMCFTISMNCTVQLFKEAGG